jgi:membrane-bound ClpP family serine protease
MGGQMERVVLFLGELALVLAGIFCIVGFALLIISMALLAVRKLLEFREL